MSGAFDEFCAALTAADLQSAHRIVDEEMRARLSLPMLMDAMIGPGMHWIGQQWESGSWSVVDEHRATSLVTRLISDLGGSPRYQRDETVVVASAEGDWHTLGVDMLAEALRDDGFEVLNVGGPIAAGHLLPLIHQVGPRAVLISCVMPANLRGARRMAVVTRDAGIPVVVGGSALTDSRARHVGANSFAATLSDAGAAVDSTPRVATSVGPVEHGRAASFDWLELHLAALAARLAGRLDPMGEAGMVEGVWVLRALSAALLCDEASILTDHFGWLERREAQTGLPAAVLYQRLIDTLADAPPAIGEFVESAWLARHSAGAR